MLRKVQTRTRSFLIDEAIPNNSNSTTSPLPPLQISPPPPSLAYIMLTVAGLKGKTKGGMGKGERSKTNVNLKLRHVTILPVNTIYSR